MMKNPLTPFAILALSSAACVNPANAAVILTAGGSVSGFQSIEPFFDAQPATAPSPGTTTDNFGAAGSIFTNATRAYYFDFGASFATVNLTQAFLGLKSFGTDPIRPTTANFYWSPTIAGADNFYDPTGRGHVAATGTGAGAASGVGGDFNIFNFNGATSDKSWQSVWSGSVTPQARYYIGSFDGTGGASNRMEEIVFIGTVPEPSVLLLFTVGGLFLLRRKR